MNTDTMPMPKVYQGRNIKRFREILGVKQGALAKELNITQQSISKLEQKEEIDDETLDIVAAFLKIPVEAIKNLGEEPSLNIIVNTFNGETGAIVGSGTHHYYECSFNPIDKIVELYERLLAAEREK